MNDSNGQYSRIEKATTVNGNIISETDLELMDLWKVLLPLKGKLLLAKRLK